MSCCTVEPKDNNLDDLIAKGLTSSSPLSHELARNLEAYRQYAVELQEGLDKLGKMIDPTDNLRRSGM